VNRPRHSGDLAHAVVEPSDREEIHALRRHLLAHIGAERSVDCVKSLGGGLEREGRLLDFRHRHYRADDPAHQREELDLAVDQHLQGRWIARRELVVFRIDHGIDPPVGLGADRVPHRDEVLVQRARRRLVVVLHELVIGGPRRADDDRRSGRSCRSGEERASRQ
jgi:hypothetical protein